MKFVLPFYIIDNTRKKIGSYVIREGEEVELRLKFWGAEILWKKKLGFKYEKKINYWVKLIKY